MKPHTSAGQAIDVYGDRVREIAAGLPPAARRVVEFIDRNRVSALANSATELAEKLGTSDATVVRAVQSLGFEGLDDMRRALASHLEGRSSPAEDMRRTLSEVGESVDLAIALVLDLHRAGLDDLSSAATQQKIVEAISVLCVAVRIFVFGIGPSAPLAHYSEILLRRDGRAARILDARGMAIADQLLDLREGDAVLALAYGQAYGEIVAVFTEAKRLGLPIVLITDSLDQRLRKRANVVIPVRRGQADRAALHGATLVALEAIILGLAASNQDKALGALDRLNDLRELVAGRRADVK